MITKIQDKLDYKKLGDIKIQTYALSCYYCRSLLCIAYIEKGILECKCSKCSRFTVVVAGLQY